MDYHIAVIGPRKIVSGFKALGVDVFDAEDGATALETIKTLRTQDEGAKRYAAIILIERLANEIPEDEYERISQGALPALVVLPGVEGTSGAGLAKLKSLTERAVGSDILG